MDLKSLNFTNHKLSEIDRVFGIKDLKNKKITKMVK